MIISTDKQFMFVHIPKTGGSSIESALEVYKSFEYDMSHPTSLQIKQWIDKDLFNSLYKFSSIRNPWDLQFSCWSYYVRQCDADIEMDFNTYIKWKFLDDESIRDGEKYIKNKNMGDNMQFLRNPYYVHRIPQVYFIIDENGKFLVDQIVNLENVDEDLLEISEKLDLDLIYVPKINISRTEEEDYRNFYTKETREIIEKRFAIDIKTFGYVFDEKKPVKPNKFIKNQNINRFNIQNDVIFSISPIPYGFYDVKKHFDNDADYQNQLQEFDGRKKEQMMNFYNSNLSNIQDNIEQFKNDIIELLDEEKNNKTLIDEKRKMLDNLINKELVYLNKISKIKKLS